MKSRYLFVFLLGCMTFFFSKTVMAQEIISENQKEILEYLLDGTEGKKEFSYVDENNEEIIVQIEYIPSMLQISAGTYKVSKTSKGNWSVSFNVTVNSSGKITGTSNLDLKALSGSILSSSLIHTSSKATCDFKRKVGILTSNVTVTATVSGDKIVVK